MGRAERQQGTLFRFTDEKPTTVHLDIFVAELPQYHGSNLTLNHITRVAYDRELQQVQMESHFDEHCSILNLYASGKFELHLNLDGYEGTWWDDRYRFATNPSLRLQLLREMPYQDYLQTPEWQARRVEQLKRSSFRCQVCNAADAELHVHHRTYERLGDEIPSDLITLCQACHELFHTHGRLVKPE